MKTERKVTFINCRSNSWRIFGSIFKYFLRNRREEFLKISSQDFLHHFQEEKCPIDYSGETPSSIMFTYFSVIIETEFSKHHSEHFRMFFFSFFRNFLKKFLREYNRNFLQDFFFLRFLKESIFKYLCQEFVLELYSWNSFIDFFLII